MMESKSENKFGVRQGNTETLLSNYKVTFITRLIIRIVTLANSIITIRIIGIHDYGGLVFLLAFVPILNAFITLGTDASLDRWIPLFKKTNPGVIPKFTNIVVLQNTLMALVVLPLFCIFHSSIAQWFKISTLGHVETLIIVAYTIVFFIGTPYNIFLRTNYDYLYLNAIELMGEIFKLFGFYIFLFSGNFNVRTLIILLTIQQTIKTVAISGRFFKKTRGSPFLKIPLHDVKEIVLYSSKMFILRAMDLILSKRGITYFIQFYLGSAALGLYAVLENAFDTAMSLSMPKDIRATINNYTLEQYASGGETAFNNAFTRPLSLQWFIGFFVCGTILSAIQPLELIYNVSYKAIPFLLVGVVIYRWFGSWLGVFSLLTQVYNRQGLRIVSKIVSTLVLFFLCNLFGSKGIYWFPVISLMILFSEVGVLFPFLFRLNRSLFMWSGWVKQMPFYITALLLLTGIFLLWRNVYIMLPLFLVMVVLLWISKAIPSLVKQDIERVLRRVINFKSVK